LALESLEESFGVAQHFVLEELGLLLYCLLHVCSHGQGRVQSSRIQSSRVQLSRSKSLSTKTIVLYASTSTLPLSILNLWRLANRLYHLLNHLQSDLLLAFAHANGHVLEERCVTNVGCVSVASNIGGPFKFGCIGMACTNVAGLKLLELLLGAELVGLFSSELAMSGGMIREEKEREKELTMILVLRSWWRW
jgi:hypothetical protein